LTVPSKDDTGRKRAGSGLNTAQKVTIVFPPGDLITSVLFEKEKNTLIKHLLDRLCSIRAIKLADLEILDDTGKPLDTTATIGVRQTVFIELVDKNQTKDTNEVDDDDDEANYITDKPHVPSSVTHSLSSNTNIPLEAQLFPDEIIALKTLKNNLGDLQQNFSDEFIMACLFNKKMNLERAQNLLMANLKWREEHKLVRIPKFSEITKELTKLYILPFGVRCNDGSGIIIYNFSYITPNKEPFILAESFKYLTWFYHVGIFSQGLDVFRNGITGICEMAGYGWKNFDLDFSKQFNSAISDKFPLRLRKIVAINAPSYMYALIKIFRVFF